MKKILLCLIILLPSLAIGQIQFRGIGQLNSTANISSYTVIATNPPAADSLVLVAVINSKASAPDIPTLTGHGMTWVQVLTMNYNTLASPLNRLTFFRSMTNDVAATNNLVADFGGVNQSGCNIRAVNLFGVVRTGTFGSDAVVQVATNSANATANPSVTLAALTGSFNAVVAFFGNDINGFGAAPEEGWIQDWEAGYKNPDSGGFCTYRLFTTDNTVSITSASADWAGVAIEVQTESEPPIYEWPYIGAEVETNGWVLRMTLSTSPDAGTTAAITNGTFFNGFGDNNEPTGEEKLWLTVSGPGFDASGTAVTRVRKIYGDKIVRLSYPMQNTNNIIAQNVTNILAKISLSGPILAGDTVTGYGLLGWFGTTNVSGEIKTNSAAFSGVSVTNSSQQLYSYMPPVWNWSRPWYNRETNSTMRLSAVGFHNLSDDHGQPLACMKFIVRDESGNAVTNVVSEMSLDYSMWQVGLLFGEYVADIPITGFTNLDQLRGDVIAYPWYGSNVFDTTLNTYTGITRMPASITNLCDWGMAYTDAIAVVSDTAGASPAITNVAPELVSSAQYYGGINAAMAAAKIYNNANFAHNDVGGAVAYVRAGQTNWTGGTADTAGTPKAVCIVQNYPGETPELNTVVGNQDISDRIKIVGINTAWKSATTPHNNTEYLWYDQVPRLTSISTAPIQNCTLVWITRSTVGAFAQGLRQASAQNTSFLLRDVLLDDFTGTVKINTTLGMRTTGASGGTNIFLDTDIDGQLVPVGYEILYNNAFLRNGRNGSMLDVYGGSNAMAYGFVAVNNIFERVTATFPLAGIASATAGTHSTNGIIWGNVFVGERIADLFSNGDETTNKFRLLHSYKNNITDLVGFKKDYDVVGTTANASRTGNWSVMFGVNFNGNAFIECRVNAAAGGFPPDFAGINSFHRGTQTNELLWAKFVDRKAYTGSGVTAAGLGNYRLRGDSPVHNIPRANNLPFNIFGEAEGITRATNPQNASMF